MTPAHVREQLSAYIDGILPADEKGRIEIHLRDCPECRRVYDELKQMLTWMRTVPKPVPRTGLETRLFARLQPEQKRRGPWFPIFGGVAGAMVAMIVVMMVRENKLDKPKARQEYLVMVNAIVASPSSPVSAARDATLASKSELRSQVSKKLALANVDAQLASPSVPGIVARDAAVRKKLGLRATAAMKLKSADRIVASQAAGGQMAREQEVSGFAGGVSPERQGFICAITKPEQRVIRTQQQWDELIRDMGPAVSSSMFQPLDFSKKMVVAVFMGEQPSSGYAVHIISAQFQDTPQGRILVVGIRKEFPPRDLMVAAVMTQPYAVKVVPMFQGHVEFRDVN